MLPLLVLAALLTGGALGAPDDALDFQKNREYRPLFASLFLSCSSGSVCVN